MALFQCYSVAHISTLALICYHRIHNKHVQAYLKGDDIALIKRLIQLHIMISRQKREDSKIAAILEEDEIEEDENVSSDRETAYYKYEEPSVDDVEREVICSQ